MKASILIVDDSPYTHKLVGAALCGAALEIYWVAGGQEAVATAAALRPSLILLDVEMAGMDGFEVCRRLQGNPRTAQIPVLFLTASTTLGDKVKGLDLGASDYITKPFETGYLRARIHSALRGRAQFLNLALVDELTGLWNRRYLDLQLPVQLSMARRTDRPLTCVMADIDELTKINNTYGEAVGDEVLRITARIFSAQGQEHDTFCYLGSGKFVGLLPATTRPGAVRLADQARVAIERQLKTCAGEELGVTCSFGIADTQADLDSALMDRGDLAIYCAKQSGPNSVSTSRWTLTEI